MPFFRTLTRTVSPLIALGAGYAFFPVGWRKNSSLPFAFPHNSAILQEIEDSHEFRRLSADPKLTKINYSGAFFSQHADNYINTGLLAGPELFEIDPVAFLDTETGEITSFYHLGAKLSSLDGQIHNGVTSTILDEGLCTAGFPLLPSKKGTTGRLSINFRNQAPPNSTLVLRAKVTEAKGRKVTISGHLETLPATGSDKPVVIADAVCILVEPRWFKWVKWLDVSKGL